MAGNREGGLKAAAKVKARDPEFFKKLGARGGKARSPYKGFGSNRELARQVGALGGRVSRRKKVAEPEAV